MEHIIRHYDPWEITSYAEVRKYVSETSEFFLGSAPILNTENREVGKVELFQLPKAFVQLVLMNDGCLTTHICGENKYKLIGEDAKLESVVIGEESFF